MKMAVRVLRDKNTDFKKLKKLQKLGYIELFDVYLEDNVPKKPGSKKIIPMEGVIGETAVLPFRLPSQEEADKYEQARKIIGRGGVRHRDALTLEAAYRYKVKYFVTENKKDFINHGKRQNLEQIFPGVKIVTLEELENLLSVKIKI